MKIIIVLIFSFYFSATTRAQQAEWPLHLSLEESVKKADIIFEGRDVKDTVVQVPGKEIYTMHYLVPLKWFKGAPVDTVKIYTPGDQKSKDIDMDGSGSNIIFFANQDYLFFCEKRKDASYFGITDTTFFPIEGGYGSIVVGDYQRQTKYAYGQNHRSYSDLTTELYQPIAKLLGTGYKIFGLNLIEEMQLKSARDKKEMDSIIITKSGYPRTRPFIRYFFWDEAVSASDMNRPASLNFSIGMGEPAGPKFQSADIYLSYDAGILGGQLVAQGLFKASLASEMDSSVYSVTASDFEPGIIKLSLTPKTNNPLNLEGGQFREKRLIRCTVYSVNKELLFIQLHLKFDEKLMQGQSFYFDTTEQKVIVFNEIWSRSVLPVMR